MGARVRRGNLALVAAAAAVALAAATTVAYWPAEPPSGAPEIRSLASASESVEYGRSYWLGQADEGGLSWWMAVAFCRDSEVASLPNCRNVLDVERASALQAIDRARNQQEAGR